MRTFLLSLFFCTSSLAVLAQDTLRVQTLTFDSITTRRGVWQFPDSSHHYRKVLMYHTLKCDPATTQDNYDCGEWDYLTYSFVHEHTGVLDSTENQSAFFKVGIAEPAQVERVAYPIFDTVQRYSMARAVTQVNSSSDHQVLTIDGAETWTFGCAAPRNRHQYIYLASELAASGLGASAIEQLRFPILQANVDPLDRVVIRMKQTALSTISTFDEQGLTTVYDGPLSLANVGLNTLTLTFPFSWSGFSNLLIDIAVENTVQVDVLMESSASAPDQVLHTLSADSYVKLGDDHIGVDPAVMADIDTAITITFWAYGDASLPANNSILEAVNAQGQRLLNVHLPWSDGRVYWDAGNDGSGYDRIDKATTAPQVEGQWNHWAFVKNTVTGQMKIYLNGTLWHTGSNKTRSMAGITAFTIGAAANGSVPYPGMIDEFNVFSTELSASTISTWMHRQILTTHPNYADLDLQLEFDEADGATTFVNSLDNAIVAWPMGTVQRVQYRASSHLRAHQTATASRPAIVFVNADLVTTPDSTLDHNLVVKPMLTQEYFEVSGNSVVPYDTLTTWGSAQQYTIAPNGTSTDSTYASGTVELNGQLTWYGVPYEVIDNWEIGRYITPYGIGLDLGNSGFTWVYDVTDYQHLLRDSVDLSSGNQQELIDLRFDMIEGDAPRPVVNLQRPWGPQTSYSYASLSDDTRLPSVNVTLDPTAERWTLRSRFTGHGHNSNDGTYPHCCEWKDNTHYLTANGSAADEWHIWQTNDCALNPVFPQGGTWLGSREGWCPGDVVKDHETDLTPFAGGGTFALDYAITPVPGNNLGMGGGNYVVNMDLFEFGPVSHVVDAEIYEVKRPSDWGYRGRENPICVDPIIVLRNSGEQDLTSVTFSYGVSGGTSITYTWTGLLKEMERTEVTVPVPDGNFWTGDSDHNFTATIIATNGGADGYADNNSYTTHFNLPVVYATSIILFYRTNNRPWENQVTIRDMWGTAVYQKDWSTLTPATMYNDTLQLTPGCYTMDLTDSGNDGLTYWADTDQGSGFFRFKAPGLGTLKNFETEFGRSHRFAFTIGNMVGIVEPAKQITFSLAPNPTAGRFTITTDEVHGGGDLDVMDALGRLVLHRSVELRGVTKLDVDLSSMEDGLYHVRLSSEGRTAQLRVVKE